jgi:hypothetical protein
MVCAWCWRTAILPIRIHCSFARVVPATQGTMDDFWSCPRSTS